MVRIPFSKITISDEEERELIECLRSGWLATGPRTEAFEREFSKIIGTEMSVAVTSGTAALHLALLTLDLQPGDEVITPSFTWVSAPNLISLLGAKPVFCDVDEETLNINAELIAPLITRRTKAIIPVHFAGLPVNMGPVYSLADKHGLVVIEDGCHALGASVNGKAIGSESNLCVFSFHPNKNITTGEGGVITGMDKKRLMRIRKLRHHGVERNSYDAYKNNKISKYDVLSLGLKYNMTDLAASIGIGQLKKLSRFIGSRNLAVQRYVDDLNELQTEIKVAQKFAVHEIQHACHLLITKVQDKPGLRDSLIAYLSSKGIQTGLHYLPVHLMTYYRDLYPNVKLPVTEKLGRTVLSLPLFPDISTQEISTVCHELDAGLRLARE
ncbi:pyridoxal phosphate-dependent aspartate aminotransferase [Oleiphilus messinensis]|uniref:Pyridoxal phosphate-dependent aspartate aminotransferase n=1 Tax=Oleiphilus messinensis TaxID=141451 RepID=A0A1Y0IBZ8_9GAMM|nr:DegT/DnrJ/EryC1/StrS aminotransferase family protein [Oleiphilus messinensis]ARU56903.1 pyridoxal phosphate-dependent aspartate aminotransferase [Oleiphilus messinensis]